MRSSIKIFSAVGVAALLAGCATTEANLHTRDTTRTAADLAKVAAQPAAAMNTSSVQVKPATYVGATAKRNLNGDPLPTKWASQNLNFARGGTVTFQDVASMITQTTGIPVSVSTAGMGDVVATASGQTPVRSTPVSQGLASGPLPADFPLDQALAQLNASADFTTTAAAAAGTSHEISGSMRLNYNGNLKGFLDLIATNFNIGWEYRNGNILFSKTVYRVFDIPALPIIAELSFDMNSKAGGSSGENSTTAGQSASTKGGFDLWADLNNTLEGLVAGTGIYKMSAQTGQVILVAPPSTADRVSQYLTQLNAQLNKQVAISVKVYSVDVGDGDDYSSDITGLFKGIDNMALSIVGQGSVTGSEGLNWAILDGGAFGGSEGIIRAISSRRDVSTVTSASVTALNGVPVPVQVAETQAYARNVQMSVSDGVVSGSVEPGEVTTGFNLHLVPKVMGNGSLLLQYGMNISELNSLVNFDVPGGGRIQLPNTTQRNFIQQAQIPNGSTLVLAGFEQVRASSESKGPGHTGLWGLGGSRKATMERNILVVAITPTVLDISAQTQAQYAQ